MEIKGLPFSVATKSRVTYEDFSGHLRIVYSEQPEPVRAAIRDNQSFYLVNSNTKKKVRVMYFSELGWQAFLVDDKNKYSLTDQCWPVKMVIC